MLESILKYVDSISFPVESINPADEIDSPASSDWLSKLYLISSSKSSFGFVPSSEAVEKCAEKARANGKTPRLIGNERIFLSGLNFSNESALLDTLEIKFLDVVGNRLGQRQCHLVSTVRHRFDAFDFSTIDHSFDSGLDNIILYH